MRTHKIFSSLIAAGLALAFISLGCGAAQDDYTVVYRSQETGDTNSDSAQQNQKPELEPTIRRQAEACLTKHIGQLSRRTYGLRYDAKADEEGTIAEINLRNTTLPRAVEECLRQVIIEMNVAESALRPHSPRPISGGERMTRERRGPLGESESQNPLVLLGPFIVEAVGIEVIVEVFFGVLAGVATIAGPNKNQKKRCIEQYVACQDTPLGRIQVDVHGSSVCDTCRRNCTKEGSWPLGFEATWGWQTCR
jgi:hypothetical protein